MISANIDPYHHGFFSIAKHKAYDDNNRNKRWTCRPFGRKPRGDIPYDCLEPVDLTGVSPNTALVNKDEREQLQKEILRFTTLTRRALREVRGGKNQRDIASELGVTIDALKYRLSKAKDQLRAIFH